MSVSGDSPPAVAAAERGTAHWVAAVRRQRLATPDHGDFYALAGEAVSTLRALHDLALVLRAQIESYSEGRQLYDDTRGAVAPAERLTVATDALGMFMHALDMADRFGNEFWSAIGHIGVVED